jgi:hypothetical protein
MPFGVRDYWDTSVYHNAARHATSVAGVRIRETEHFTYSLTPLPRKSIFEIYFSQREEGKKGLHIFKILPNFFSASSVAQRLCERNTQ